MGEWADTEEYFEDLRQHALSSWETGEPTFDQQVKAARRGGQERKMSTALAKSNVVGLDRKTPSIDGLERVLIEGDLGGLSQQERIEYYARVCESTGLNPLTQPFEYLRLQGKTILYARRACTDQLRQIHKVSVTIVSREKLDGVYVVTARAETPDGRTDESIGAVPIENVKGEALANALMKAETKAKRRVTLAICGLSMLDESELEGVKDKIGPARKGKPARTLDDVAQHGHAAERADDGDAGPAVMEGELVDLGGTIPEPAELTEPSMPCPKFGVGQHKGKLVTDVPVGYLRWCAKQTAFAESSDEFRAWVTFCIARREQEKAAEQASNEETST